MSDENENTEMDVDQQAMADEWAAAMEEQTADASGADDAVSAVAFDELSDDSSPGHDPKLDVIMDIPVSLSMEVGSTEISIRNLLQLSQGSVVELDRVAGEPLDVMVNGTLIAHGEVVVVNERYGIRLTDVISPQERIKRLK
ncbi:flagellar motor switch protein FliN [Neptunomonas phycophila]|jgi:flagellar motor switch protein FliN/FliY|uniref:Flagellar motor switch protein FliN n=1 Tax=Neptunomonas phycophila TaxID=1572645 RepID=A0AAW7XNA4_9GAMM|nr:MULTISPECIES: flagellar motor switch protein FliN [Neptunomonas]MBT3144358.1 flagellar motor switch protein FliN [Neptunomonas phycophila]MDN2660504.1 flagellar motor switch protein FliN [Neptunomonas sp. CHC150]MDO6455236.1 flagellar motor switch protein FliN [Neptunomonas phycophila]MDO6469771.1 flagellar motor switch protein FliN [Neptunomonas phycophila]MDP2524087.1 flagellar motor switch protein FliN [Neptunomonas phycophila]